jgi:hypothetical protein
MGWRNQDLHISRMQDKTYGKKSTHIFGTGFVLLASDGEILQSEDLEHLALTEMVGFK